MAVLARADYATAPDPNRVTAWQREQEPTVDGIVQTDRIRVVKDADVPGYKPAAAMRAEIRPGEVTWTGTYSASRTEVLGRQAPTGTPAEQWPDPVGSVRWYGFGVYLDPTWTFATDDKWTILTQWKGVGSGSPAVELDIDHHDWRLGGQGGYRRLARAEAGRWSYFQLGICFSPDPAIGWAEVWLDGTQALPQTHRLTMNLWKGAPDPSYLKQGIYRTTLWDTTAVAYFGDLTIGTDRDSVGP